LGGVKFRGPKLTGVVRGATILFDATVITEEAKPFWVQIAQAGVYKGYSAGPVTFDLAMFDKLIENFRSHPWYKAGPDGVGMTRVVPYDYEHASEMDPSSGSIPQKGATAPAWALEIEMRDGGDAGPQLWALTDPVNDEVRKCLKEGGYRSTSVAIWNNAVDGVTGKKIGAVLTSIAFTNHPFIEGMAPIAARVDQWGEAESPEELIIGLRQLFGLDVTATPADIMAQLVALQAAFSNNLTLPAYPEGVSPLIDRLRCLVGLPVLTPAPAIIDAAGHALNAVPASSPPAPTETGVSPTMALDPKRLLIILRVKGTPADEETAILMAAEQGAQATDAISQLQAMFGSTETKDLIAKAGAAIAASEKVKGLVEALTAAQNSLAEQDSEVAEGEVDAVAASMGLSADVLKRLRPVMLQQRLDAGKDKATLTKWREDNAITAGARPGRDAAQVLLTRPIVAGPNGTQLGNHGTGGGGSDGGKGSQLAHPMLGYPGRNQTEQARAYLSDKIAGFSKHDAKTQLSKTAAYLREGAAVIA
jgi:hypothetical protein